MIGPQLIDLGNPVADHPLNTGRVLWLYGLPNNSGGSRWFDITKNRNDGTLTNGPTWAATGRGDSGLNLTAASSQYVDCGNGSGLEPGASGSVFLWMKATAVPQPNFTTAFCKQANSSSNSPWSLDFSSDGNHMRGYIANGGTLNSVTTAAPAAGAWIRWGMTWDGSTVRTWQNGAQLGSTSQTINPQTGTGNVLTGCWSNSSATKSLYLNGSVADASVWSRALSASEVLADCDLSRRGYPGVLRRYRSPLWVPASGYDGSLFPRPSDDTPGFPRAKTKVVAY